MKFKCGRTQEEIDNLIIASRERREARSRWHTWYAVKPVSVARGHCRWLETVERREDVVFGETVWRYRDVGSKGDGYVPHLNIDWPLIVMVVLVLGFCAAPFLQ